LRLEAGGWRLEAGGWRLEAGGWKIVILNTMQVPDICVHGSPLWKVQLIYLPAVSSVLA